MKKILLSLAVLALVAVAGYAGTRAFFSDTEVSAGNVFTAGAIDLTVDHERATYNGVDCETCGVELYSGDGQNMVVGGTNTEKTNFPFPAVEVSNPHANWDDHQTAEWIWATPTTLVGDDGSEGDDTTYVFERTFQWNGTAGTMSFNLDVGADNDYVVYLNGTLVDSGSGYTSIDDASFSDNLQNGENVLKFEVTNNYNAQYTDSNTPEDNPGGLLYYLNIQREDCEVEDSNFQQWCQLWEAKDLENEKFFNFDDIKPGDSGRDVISLHVETNDAYACAYVESQDNLENGINDPESEVDTTSGTHDGELGSELMFFAWDDLNQDGNFDRPTETPLMSAPDYADNLGAITFADSLSSPLTAGDTSYLGVAWCAGTMSVNMTTGDIGCDGADMGNESQTDSFLADLVFYAVQSRNNEGFA